jgi:tetratricopeptide (TPR) repeat protein
MKGSGFKLKKRLFSLSLLVFILFISVSSFADQELDYKLQQGRKLEQRGRAAEAQKIYEDLYPDYPDDLRLYESLRRVYRRTRNYPKWIHLAQEKLKKHPNDSKFIESLTEAYLRSGKRDDAFDVGRKIYHIKPPKEEDYNKIGALFLTHRMPSEAIQIYLRARSVFQNESLFSPLVAKGYRAAKNDKGAAEEYLRMMKGMPALKKQGENGIRQLIRRGDTTVIIPVLKDVLKKEPQRKDLYTLIGDIQLKEGKYEEALKSYEKGDAEDPLYSLARKAEEEEKYDIALRSYQSFAESGKPIALYRMGITHWKMGNVEEAILTLKSLIKNHSKTSEGMDAVRILGEIYLNDLRDPGKAEDYFKKYVSREPKEEKKVLDAQFSLVECQIMKENFGKVEKGLLGLINSPYGDRALFQLGEVYFYQGDFESSLDMFNRIVQEYPKSVVENNALRRIIQITDNMEDETLKEIAEVELLGRQGKFEDGIEILRNILNSEPGKESSKIIEDVILLMGNIYEGLEDYPASISAYENLVERNPESILAPEALRRAGEVYFVRLGDRKHAIEMFERVLLEYPKAVQTDIIRKRVEELKEEL